MPVIDVVKDVANRTLTITAEFRAPVARVWALYADPRQLEKVWGPPSFPATFVEHDLAPGGRCTYYMTGPDGERHGGWWQITAVDEPNSLAFDEGFANGDLTPDPGLPVSHSVYSFAATDDGGTRATYVTTFDSAEDLATVLDMGTADGLRDAINQIDEFLAGTSPD